jgi:hypothetical protein
LGSHSTSPLSTYVVAVARVHPSRVGDLVIEIRTLDRVQRRQWNTNRSSGLAAAANVGTAEDARARREAGAVAGGADDRLHRADDDGRLAAV